MGTYVPTYYLPTYLLPTYGSERVGNTRRYGIYSRQRETFYLMWVDIIQKRAVGVNGVKDLNKPILTRDKLAAACHLFFKHQSLRR